MGFNKERFSSSMQPDNTTSETFNNIEIEAANYHYSN